MNIDYEYDSSWVYNLKPAQFEFKKFPGNVQYGLIAEDVADINSQTSLNIIAMVH